MTKIRLKQERLEEFERMVANHDLTYNYSDDPRWYHAGQRQYDDIMEAAKWLPEEDVERIWNKYVDQKLMEHARSTFYWRKK